MSSLLSRKLIASFKNSSSVWSARPSATIIPAIELANQFFSADDISQLDKLSSKYGFILNFEGGEADTFVIDCPLYSHPIKITKSKVVWDGYIGRFEIEDAHLDSNAR